MSDNATQQIDLKLENERYKTAILELVERYGTATDVPYEDQFAASERLRAACCISSNPDVPRRQVFKAYSVDRRVWHHFIDGDDVAAVDEERKMTRADKQAKVLAWAADNVGKETTLEEVMRTCDVAYSMAKKITEDRPDVFRKIKRGKFSVRDPKADRAADKSAAK